MMMAQIKKIISASTELLDTEFMCFWIIGDFNGFLSVNSCIPIVYVESLIVERYRDFRYV